MFLPDRAACVQSVMDVDLTVGNRDTVLVDLRAHLQDRYDAP